MKKYAAFACILLALAVSAGAFGAHALRGMVSAADLAIWDKAVLYQAIHALTVLFIVSSLMVNSKSSLLRLVINLFVVSIMIFSGSLYILVLSQQRWLGMITPIGGAGFIVAWILLACHLKR